MSVMGPALAASPSAANPTPSYQARDASRSEHVTRRCRRRDSPAGMAASSTTSMVTPVGSRSVTQADPSNGDGPDPRTAQPDAVSAFVVASTSGTAKPNAWIPTRVGSSNGVPVSGGSTQACTSIAGLVRGPRTS